MSPPTGRVTGPLVYAPKWARDAAIAEQRNAVQQHPASMGDQEVLFGSALYEARSSGDDWRTEWSHAARPLDPVVLTPPPPRSLLQVGFAIAGGLAISATAGAITALFVVGKFPSGGLIAKGDRLEATSVEARFIGQNAPTSNLDLFSYSYPSQLASINVARQRENQEAHLAEPLRGADHASSTATDGANAAPANEETRLAGPMREAAADQASSRASKGPSAPTPANEETADRSSRAATDGASPSALANEERLAEPLPPATADQASSRTTDGTAPSARASEEPRLAEPPTVEHVTEPTSPSLRAPSPDEVALFLKHGQELMARGDIAAARVLLLRAAEARDPKAALALAATFDPIILERVRAYGAVPDVSSARRWYEKAKEFGSEEAPRRLEMLARREM
jgi:hypothetical protein